MAARVKAEAKRRASSGSRTRIREVFGDSPLPKPNDAVGFLLWRTLLVYQQRVEQSLDAVGLTHLQFAVLATAGWLSLSRAEVSQRDIVRQSGIKEAQLSLMIKALRTKGLLVQEPGEHDPRVRAIRLTERGARSLKSAIPLISDVQNELWPTRAMQRETSAILMDALRRWGILHVEASA